MGSGIPSLKWFGVQGHYNAMVIDLLGQSLEDLFSYCNRKLTLKAVLMLNDVRSPLSISRVEYMHLRGFLHQDITPDNFLMGLFSHVYVCMLLLLFCLTITPTVFINRKNKNLTGTARYASVNTHFGVERNRRFDLESLGYVLMYFLRGRLSTQILFLQGSTRRYKHFQLHIMLLSFPSSPSKVHLGICGVNEVYGLGPLSEYERMGMEKAKKELEGSIDKRCYLCEEVNTVDKHLVLSFEQ
ncbi:unnamed protein product [Eruca vesicaria subsp. sativa]|uniref:Protein kinase domain-containing protein n=1 Tax=Eruca vesicaria subsp. sativa TaxID=29727 RepID=A0ABC8JBW0_ERUVS|nr:unnamed protein product [Eruca vesicaria subsp. sativa]